MASKQLVSVEAGVPVLSPDASAEGLADACRAAGLLFLDGVATGRFGKRELAEWLLGPYHDVSARLEASQLVPATSPLRDGAVESLVEMVRVAVASGLADVARGDTSVITHAIRGRIIASARRGRGLFWVPADRPRMRLEARVMSLFVVDYLLRSEPYETSLSVCAECDSVSFDGAKVSCRSCSPRERTSHIRGPQSQPGILKSSA